MRLAVLALLTGCSLYFNGNAPGGGGGGRGGGPGAGGGDAGPGWVDTCPGDSAPGPDDTCTPGSTCDYESWEHACSCACNEDGKWHCVNETVGSSCTTGTYSPFEAAPDPVWTDAIAPALHGSGEIVFVRRGPNGDRDLWSSTISMTTGYWLPAVRETALSTSPANEDDPSLSSDGLTIYFMRGTTLMQATRASPTSPWGSVTAVAGLAGYGAVDFARADTALIVTSQTTDPDLYESTRTTSWSAPRRIDEIASSAIDRAGTMRFDGHELIFESTRGGTHQLFHALRDVRSSPWAYVDPIDLPDHAQANVSDPELSDDGLTLYFVSDIAGTPSIYVASRQYM